MNKKNKVNLKEWKEKHPNMSAIAERTEDPEMGIIELHSHNKEAVRRQFSTSFSDEKYILVE